MCVIDLMKTNVRAYNNIMDLTTLSKKEIPELLANYHPSDRSRFETMLEDEQTKREERIFHTYSHYQELRL